MDTIALQPSEGARRLPAVGGSRTIPRHAGRLRRARVARLHPPRHARNRNAPRRGPAHRVLRIRSDRAQPAARQSDARHAAAAFPARRPSPDRADGRRHRTDRRSERQTRRATAALEGADPREPAPPARSDGPAARLRLARYARRGAGQRGVAHEAEPRGLPARRRQALQRQRHAAEGVGEGAHRWRHLVHRIQLHVAPGVRLSALVPRARLHHSGRRKRSVGEHHGGDRPDPAREGRRGARPGRTAGHDGVGREVREDRGGGDLPRSGAHLAVRVLPILEKCRRPRRGAVPEAFHLQDRRRDPGLDVGTLW